MLSDHQTLRHYLDWGSQITPMFFLYFLKLFFKGRPTSKEISVTTERIFPKFSGLLQIRKGILISSDIFSELTSVNNTLTDNRKTEQMTVCDIFAFSLLLQ